MSTGEGLACSTQEGDAPIVVTILSVSLLVDSDDSCITEFLRERITFLDLQDKEGQMTLLILKTQTESRSFGQIHALECLAEPMRRGRQRHSMVDGEL